MAEQSEPVTT